VTAAGGERYARIIESALGDGLANVRAVFEGGDVGTVLEKIAGNQAPEPLKIPAR
jgi:hypothetical protein